MTYRSLLDMTQGDIQRLHHIAHLNGWDEIKRDARDAMQANHRSQQVRDQ